MTIKGQAAPLHCHCSILVGCIASMAWSLKLDHYEQPREFCQYPLQSLKARSCIEKGEYRCAFGTLKWSKVVAYGCTELHSSSRWYHEVVTTAGICRSWSGITPSWVQRGMKSAAPVEPHPLLEACPTIISSVFKRTSSVRKIYLLLCTIVQTNH